MLPDGRRLGAHLPLGAGMVKAVERAHAIGATALQVFSDNPTAWRRRPGPPKELPAFRARLDHFDIAPLAIHAAYLVNLAGPDDDFYARSLAVLVHELRTARQFGARFVNVHVGSHRGIGVEAGIRRVADGVAHAFDASTPDPDATAGADSSADAGAGADESASADEGASAEADPIDDGSLRAEAAAESATEAPAPADAGRAGGAADTTRINPDPMIVLENSAGGGYGMGATLDELGAIFAAIVDRGVDRERVGFCLDAAHLWGAGYEISDERVLDAVVDEFDGLIGLDRLAMIHLNDSRAQLGSHLDRHQHVGAGAIGPDGMRHLIRHPKLAQVTYYVETPGMDLGYDEVNIRRALDLAAGLDLEELPPEALSLRGSRARSAPADDE